MLRFKLNQFLKFISTQGLGVSGSSGMTTPRDRQDSGVNEVSHRDSIILYYQI